MDLIAAVDAPLSAVKREFSHSKNVFTAAAISSSCAIDEAWKQQLTLQTSFVECYNQRLPHRSIVTNVSGSRRLFDKIGNACVEGVGCRVWRGVEPPRVEDYPIPFTFKL
eukprot:scaffold1457_cov111-Skeletonema_dohrnii-CCMP3373.AAC.6